VKRGFPPALPVRRDVPARWIDGHMKPRLIHVA
jgi:hypothetical protein